MTETSKDAKQTVASAADAKLCELKVAAASNPSSVAGSLVKNIQEGKDVTLLCIGASAVNQAVKALGIARGYIASQGVDLYFKVGFTNLMIDGNERTALKFFTFTK